MQVVSTREYIEARQRLLEKEKEWTRLGDALSKERRALPAVRVLKNYHFTDVDATGNKVERSLQDLFEERPQLMVYYFMFDPSADAGCPACSFTADCIPALQHLNSRGVTLACVSRAPIEKLVAYKQRLGFTFPWVSTYESDFNLNHEPTMLEDDETTTFDSGSKEQALRDNMPWFTKGEKQGLSCFIKGNSREGIGEDGQLYHTYSTFGKGVEPVLSTYGLLDMTKLGRQDSRDGVRMVFRRNDEYSEDELKGIWS